MIQEQEDGKESEVNYGMETARDGREMALKSFDTPLVDSEYNVNVGMIHSIQGALDDDTGPTPQEMTSRNTRTGPLTHRAVAARNKKAMTSRAMHARSPDSLKGDIPPEVLSDYRLKSVDDREVRIDPGAPVLENSRESHCSSGLESGANE